MKVQIYLLNKTYIAEDLSTGLMAYGETQEEAEKKLMQMANEYWQKKKVIVPINKDSNEIITQDSPITINHKKDSTDQ